MSASTGMVCCMRFEFDPVWRSFQRDNVRLAAVNLEIVTGCYVQMVGVGVGVLVVV